MFNKRLSKNARIFLRTRVLFFFLAKEQRNELWDGNLSQMTSSGNRQPIFITFDCTACL